MLRMTLTLAVCVLACVLAVPVGPAVQSPVAAGKRANLAQMPLEDVQIEGPDIVGLFSHLSFAYDIPFGLEVARDEDASADYRINFKKGTLSELLTQFVAEYDRYAWQIEGGVVSVFPKDAHRDLLLRELLATEIGKFSVKEKTSCEAFGQSLLSAPEIRKILEGYGVTYDTDYLGGFYIQQLGQSFSFNISKVRMKAVLDKVVKESPVARMWVIKRNPAVQRLTLNVKAELEEPPKPSEKPIPARQELH